STCEVPLRCDVVDCNTNGTPDVLDILYGNSQDTNGNGTPDECESDAPGGEGGNMAQGTGDGDSGESSGGDSARAALHAWDEAHPVTDYCSYAEFAHAEAEFMVSLGLESGFF